MSWRVAIEDPLEVHDLGRVVHSRAGMIHIQGELRRGALLFAKSLAHMVPSPTLEFPLEQLILLTTSPNTSFNLTHRKTLKRKQTKKSMVG